MALPKQIRDQAVEIEELEKQLYGDQQPTDPDVPVAEIVTPEAEQSAEPIEQPEPETVEEAPEKQEKDDAKVWQQKYKTLQGMYDAEVPRLHTQLKTMQAEFDALKSSVEKANNEAEESKQAAKKAASRNLVTDEDRKEFGEDMIEFQRKVAREETAELSDKLEAVAAQNNELNEQLVRQGETVRESSFEQRLTALVPDFAQLNVDPVWIKWLGENDPMLRGPRSSAAQRAYTEGDAEGVAHYVNLFRESQQAAEPAKQDTSLEIESQIQPSKAASATQSRSAPQGKTYSDADIRQMFTKVMQLNNSNRTDDAQKLEAEIDAAYAQGRVTA